MIETASVPERRENHDDQPLFALQTDGLQPAFLSANDERIQKEIDVEVGEIQSVFVEVGETLGVVSSYDHNLIVATKKWMSKQILDFEIGLVRSRGRSRIGQ